MRCPRHQTELESQSVQDHSINQCPECAGVFLPGPAIDKLLGAGEMLKLRSLCSVQESDLQCPADGRKMTEGKVGPVTLDLCPDCRGLWLDPGELDFLRQRKGITPHQTTATTVTSNPEVSASSELLLYALLGVI